MSEGSKGESQCRSYSNCYGGAPEQKKTRLRNRDAEKFWHETYTGDRVDKKS